MEDELDDRDEQAEEFSDSPAGRKALDRWASRYDDRNGAPEGDWDR